MTETIATGQGQPQQQGEPPLRPGLDTLTGLILGANEFARDAGGELFMLPGAGLRDRPYLPRSFLTADVMNAAHDLWRHLAVAWNGYAADHPEAGKPVAYTPSDTLVRNAVRHLEALGTEHGRRVTAELRAVRRTPGEIIIDLGDETGDVAYVTADGWKTTDPRDLPCPPPVFRRSAGYGPLPRPERGGDLAELWDILHVADPAAVALGTGWSVAAYFADIPRPGVWPTGPPGAGKTTLAGGLARLIDGTEWLDGRLDSGDERNNIIRAATCYVVSFDNMSAVTADLSDWICQLVTGHRDKFRRMRTNFEDVSVAYRRTFVATGLSLPYGLRSDALDRVIEMPLTAIGNSGRVNETLIRRELDAARPRLLGALLDHVAAVLAVLPRIPDSGFGLDRMNEYAHILMAHDVAYGDGALPCLDAYLTAVATARADRADDAPVVAALGRMITPGSWWQGTPTQLWTALNAHRNFGMSGGDLWWPGSARALSDHLTEHDSELRAAGLAVTRSRQGKARLIRIDRPA